MRDNFDVQQSGGTGSAVGCCRRQDSIEHPKAHHHLTVGERGWVAEREVERSMELTLKAGRQKPKPMELASLFRDCLAGLTIWAVVAVTCLAGVARRGCCLRCLPNRCNQPRQVLLGQSGCCLVNCHVAAVDNSKTLDRVPLSALPNPESCFSLRSRRRRRD